MCKKKLHARFEYVDGVLQNYTGTEGSQELPSLLIYYLGSNADRLWSTLIRDIF